MLLLYMLCREIYYTKTIGEDSDRKGEKEKKDCSIIIMQQGAAAWYCQKK